MISLNKYTLTLTEKESDTWNWAFDAARDFWADDDGRDDGLHFEECPVSHARNGMATIVDHPEVLDDMRYRLGEQLPAMAGEQGGFDRRGRADAERMQALQEVASAKRILAKLDEAEKHN